MNKNTHFYFITKTTTDKNEDEEEEDWLVSLILTNAFIINYK
jgi:hypothetical protein